MVVRAARTDERASLEALQRRASLMHSDTRAALLAHPEAIDLPFDHIQYTLVADDSGQPLGFAVVLPRTDGDAELDGMFVEPASWRRGIGSALVAAAVSLARQQGAFRLAVVANRNALDFYRQCGFIQTGITTTQFGDGIIMGLAIDQGN